VLIDKYEDNTKKLSNLKVNDARMHARIIRNNLEKSCTPQRRNRYYRDQHGWMLVCRFLCGQPFRGHEKSQLRLGNIAFA
jgi:hypothetical protein